MKISLVNLLQFLAFVLMQGCGGLSQERKEQLNFQHEINKIAFDNISSMTTWGYRKLENDLNDPITASQVERFKPIYDKIQLNSKTLISYIDSIAQLLISSPGKSNREKVSRKVTDVLYDKLKAYSPNIFAMDSSLYITFKNKDIIKIGTKSESPISRSKFFNSFFRNKEPLEVLLNLDALKNSVAVFESQMIRYYCSKYTRHEPWYTTYGVLVGQSSNYIKSGDLLLITAGIGNFSTKANPTIVIGKDTIKINENGVAEKKIKTPKKPGKYTVPVHIVFMTQDSSFQTKDLSIEYEVIR